jgi:hypothetical protein
MGFIRIAKENFLFPQQGRACTRQSPVINVFTINHLYFASAPSCAPCCLLSKGLGLQWDRHCHPLRLRGDGGEGWGGWGWGRGVRASAARGSPPWASPRWQCTACALQPSALLPLHRLDSTICSEAWSGTQRRRPRSCVEGRLSSIFFQCLARNPEAWGALHVKQKFWEMASLNMM